MNSRKAVLCAGLLLFFAFSGCDSFSLFEQFTIPSAIVPPVTVEPLTLTVQKTSILRGETIELYPAGGTEPYVFGVIAVDLAPLTAAGYPGSIADRRFTAGSAIGKIALQVTDAAGKTASVPVFVLPPAPTSFSLTRDTINNTITLSWEYAEPAIISGFLLKRTVNGVAFTDIPRSTTQLSYFDTNLNPSSATYIYYLYAVSGAYSSLPAVLTSAPQ